ncbi:MAG: gliding motility-associated C-terminal domain-containing protein [Bacteroidia bacterium]|nr:gliding motility-associated C-terminal domain-containing protein [Bacteroidia bacterium]
MTPGFYASYLWQDGSSQATFEVVREGEYQVKVADFHNCEGSDTVILREICPPDIYLPNAFSPNDDGHNDHFGIHGQYLIQQHLTIFNRWGQVIFESFQMEDHWDGRIKGIAAAEGVYVWKVDYEAYLENGTTYSETLTGTVTLIR